jgi:ubiquinone/menaquinone biosynthesis C-methylase UbiE
MATENPLALPDVWNEVADGYADELVPLFDRYALDALDLVRPGPAAHIVDVAAGPGTLTLRAAPRVARVAAVDFSPEMVRVLGRRAAEGGFSNVDVQVADGQNLPFDDGAFDAGFSMFGLMFFPDRAAGFGELLRVVRPGSRVVVASWAPMDRVPLLGTLFSLVRELVPGMPFGPAKAPLVDVKEFRGEMVAVGYEEVEIHSVEHSVEVPSLADFWRVQERSSAPIALLRRSIPTDEWESFGREVIARLQRELGGGPYDVSFEARLGTGMRPR